jgi:putative ABC transport system permease protein
VLCLCHTSLRAWAKQNRPDLILKTLAMLRNYIKIAFRNLVRKKFFSLLNIAGLAIGLSCCTIIVLYVVDELNYDRFHAQADRIYRVRADLKFGENEMNSSETPVAMAAVLADDFPEVEASTRYNKKSSTTIQIGERVFSEKEAAYVDSSFFRIFSFQMLEGDPHKALAVPDGIVLTQEAAERYFGKSRNLLGTQLYVDNNLVKVSGILANVPSNSSLSFKLLLPALQSTYMAKSNEWNSFNVQTFFLLREGADVNVLEAKFPEMINRYVGPQMTADLGQPFADFLKKGNRFDFENERLADIHLKRGAGYGELSSGLKTIYIFACVAIFILVLACVNFMNLSTARSAERAKEVGIRKVLGSVRNHLVGQFIAEAVLITAIAMALSFLLSELSLPFFNQLANKSLSLSDLANPTAVLAMLMAVLLIGVFSGSYPAFYLTAFKPVEVLKGKLPGGKSNWLRSSLVVFQFCVSVMLIICTILVYTQLSYMRNQELGFNKDNVLVLRNGFALQGKVETFKARLKAIPEVKEVSISNSLPAIDPDGVRAFRNLDGSNQELMLNAVYADFDITQTLGLKIIEGRNFDPQLASDSNAVLINEAAALKLGYANPVGKEIDKYEGPHHKIIGVVENFHMQSLKDVITPLVVLPTFKGSYVTIKADAGFMAGTIAQVEEIWREMAPQSAFEYTFFDEDLAAQYDSEQRLGQIFSLFTGLAILIACLGLFGLAAFTAEQRTKEIGIRKVLGASVVNIAGLLSKDFLMLVLIANLIAWPLAWWAMSKWLEDFAYRIEIGWWVFALAGLSALAIALITVSFQAVKAAVANPVKSLRTE